MQPDEIAARIEAFDSANGGGVFYYRDKGAYRLYLVETEAPIARLKPTGTGDEVRLGYWSHRRKWEDIDDMGGVTMPLDDALEFIANDAIFWTWTSMKMYKVELRNQPMYLTMNRFKVALGQEDAFEEIWASRDSHLKEVEGFVAFHLLKGETKEDHTLYASHTVWQSREAFEGWTKSDAFRKAHSGVRPQTDMYLGPPQLEVFESVQNLT